MMTRRAFGHSMFVAFAVLSLGACSDGRFPDYNYKMTIHVGDKAFSSVRRVEQEEIGSVQSSSGRTVRRTLTGQAVILDVDGRTYYALLTKPDNADYALLITGAALAPAIPDPKPESEQDAAVREWRSDQGKDDPAAYLDEMAERSEAMTKVEGAHPLPRSLPARQGRPPVDAWPMFVTFDDPKDPTTVREVSPDSIGVDKITIEITDDDVTTGIKRRLNWLSKHRGSLVRGRIGVPDSEMAPAQRLNSLAFVQEWQ